MQARSNSGEGSQSKLSLGLKMLSSGHVVEELDDETCKKINRNFDFVEKSIRLRPGDWFFEQNAPKVLEKVYNFQFNTRDVFVIASPKSGITWTQEILWTFLYNSNLDNPKSKQVITLRSPQLDGDLFFAPPKAPKIRTDCATFKYIASISSDEVNSDEISMALTKALPSPRVIKCHLPLSLLPKNLLQKTKVLYIARDPRDVIISRYNFIKFMKINTFLGSFDEYIDHFLNEEVYYSPFWTHVKEAWSMRNHPNLLFLMFEDMVANPMEEYQKINKFLNLNLSNEQVAKIVEYTSFASMKRRSEDANQQPMAIDGQFIDQNIKRETGGFFRKGKVGDWTNNFNDAQVFKINAWIEKNCKEFPQDFPYRK